MTDSLMRRAAIVEAIVEDTTARGELTRAQATRGGAR